MQPTVLIGTLMLGVTIEWVLFLGPVKVSKSHRENVKDNLYDATGLCSACFFLDGLYNAAHTCLII